MIRAGSAARRSFTRSVNTGGPRILDALGVSAAAAYSLRKLRAAYTGAAVNVRRSSDSATQDIGFVNGSLDTSALSAFIGAGSGFVAKWYDQSGNGNDAIQATAANQPQLITGVAALNTRGALLFGNGSTANLQAASSSSIDGFMSGSSAGTVSMVCNITAASTGNRRYWEKGGFTQLTNIITAGGNLLGPGYSTTGGQFGTTFTPSSGAYVYDVQYLWTLTSNVPIFTVNGAPQTISSTTTPVGTAASDSGIALNIGNSASSQGFPGHIAEAIFWKNGPPASAMPSVRANQKAYWGTP